MISEFIIAAKNKIKKDMNLTEHEIRIMPDGRPIPTMGEFFIAVHMNDWSFPGQQEYQFEEEYGMSCTITLRKEATPYDSIGESKYLQNWRTLIKLAREVILAVHNQWDIVQNASEYTDGSNEINRAFKVLSAGNPELVDESWFMQPDNIPPDFNIERNKGLTIEIQFGQAGRVQPQDDGDLE